MKGVAVDSKRMSEEQADAFIDSLHEWRGQVDALRDKHQRIQDVQVIDAIHSRSLPTTCEGLP